MMRHRLTLLIVGLALASFGCMQAVAPPEPASVVTFTAEGVDAIRAQIQSDIEAQRIVGAVAILAQGNRVEFVETFGVRDREAAVPMQEDAIFRIYSMTKPITSTAVMMLVEGGEIDLDDPAAVYMPELGGLEVGVEGKGDAGWSTVPAERDMTVRDLLRHTSGLTYGIFASSAVDRQYMQAGIFDAQTLADTLTMLADLPLKHQPGTRFEYSLSTDVLGRLVEVVSGQSLGKFLKSRIFEPLGMVDTGFYVPEDKLDRFAAHYDRRGAELQRTDQGDQYVVAPTYLSGGGGLVSTAADYLRFSRMILDGGELDGVRLLQPETVAMMGTDQVAEIPGHEGDTGFGLGFSVLRKDSPEGAAGTIAWGGLASTRFWIDRANGIVGIYMVQVQPSNPALGARFQQLAYEALAS